MHWLTILLIGIAANIDNLGIGVSYSLKSTRIPLISNLLIAIVSMVAAYLSVAAGALISHYISVGIANLSGGLLIIVLGIICIIECCKQEKKTSHVIVHSDSNFSRVVRKPESLDLNNDKIISWKESVLLGLALAINCLAIGLGAGITGVPPILATISIGLFSVISIACGVMVGNKLIGTRVGKYSNIAAGVMLILIGIYEMFI